MSHPRGKRLRSGNEMNVGRASVSGGAVSGAAAAFGVTKPLSMDSPTEAELRQSQRLQQALRTAGLYESAEEADAREAVLEKLLVLVRSFFRSVALRDGMTAAQAKEVGGKVSAWCCRCLWFVAFFDLLCGPLGHSVILSFCYCVSVSVPVSIFVSLSVPLSLSLCVILSLWLSLSLSPCLPASLFLVLSPSLWLYISVSLCLCVRV